MIGRRETRARPPQFSLSDSGSSRNAWFMRTMEFIKPLLVQAAEPEDLHLPAARRGAETVLARRSHLSVCTTS